MITFSKAAAELFVPDGLEPEAALARTTHLGIGAHQDDLEFFAAHGILECFGREDRWFSGVIATDGAGSARAGLYERFDDEEMAAIRRREQNKAAVIGEYGAIIQLCHSSAEIKNPTNRAPVEDIRRVLELARPAVVYLHNPCDKHDTHVALLCRCVEALRELPPEQAPRAVYGCEVWRDLDWVPDDLKIALPVAARANLQSALNGVFDSQISGGKRYDLAVMGRRLAHATFYESHAIDRETGLTFAIDLTECCRPAGPSLAELSTRLITALREEVLARLVRAGGL